MASKRACSSINLSIWAVLTLFLLAGLTGCNMPKGYTGTPVKVLLVMVKWSHEPNCPTPEACLPSFSAKDVADINTPRHYAKDYTTLLTTRINEYYQNVSYGQVYFQFDLLENPDSPDGWWDSYLSLADINKFQVGWKQLAMNIAYTELGDKLYDYERVLFISNMQHRGGQTCCLHAPTPFYAIPGQWLTIDITKTNTVPVNIPMIVAEVGEGVDDNELITVTSHELGHAIGAPDHYYGGSVGMGQWDLMDHDWDYFHFGAWTKLDRGWIDWVANTTIFPCLTGSCEITTVLDPQEKIGNNALLIPKYSGSEFVGIMVECRKKINGDEGIPQEGLLVTLSNPYLDKVYSQTVSSVLSNKPDPYSLLQPGEEYYNQVADVHIYNKSKPGDETCTVKATRSVKPAPDLVVTQGAMDSSGPIDRFTSVDIWNDTGINGWDKFPSYEHVNQILTQLGKMDVPDGYGDPIITAPGQANSARGIFHNDGEVVAENIKVSLYMRQPLSVSVQTEGCGAPADSPWFGAQNIVLPELLYSREIDSLSPGQIDGMGEAYQTTSTAPLELSFEVDPVAGEVRLDNNVAYETYTKFYGDTSIQDALVVNLSDQCRGELPFMAMEIPAEDGSKCEVFDLTIEPSSGFIQPGETVNFNVTAKPRAGTRAGQTCRSQIGVFMPVTSVYTPVATFGFEARVIEPAELTCDMRAGSNGLTIAGQLDPAQVEPIALAYTNPLGEQTLKNLQTLDNGQYFDELTSPLPGMWTAQAWWVGDDTHAPTNSELCSFAVEEPVVKEPPIFRAVSPSNCRQGPSTFYGSQGITTQGVEYPITGLNQNSAWYRIQFSEALRCWVKADPAQISGDLSGVEVLVVDIITPTPPLIPTFTPTQVSQSDPCNQWDFNYCVEKYAATCKWDGPNPGGICVSK